MGVNNHLQNQAFYPQREPPFALNNKVGGLQEWSTRFGEDTTVNNI